MLSTYTINDRTFSILHAGYFPIYHNNGYHWLVWVALWYRNDYRIFNALNDSDLKAIVEDANDRYAAQCGLIVADIAEEVTEWANSIDEKEREDDSLPSDSVAGAMDEANN